MFNRLTQSLDFNAQALTLRAERQRLIASNIANADTPGFAGREMDFPQALRLATGMPGVGSNALRSDLNKTHAAHLSLPGGLEGASATALKYAATSQTNLDSNSVDMDRERASFAENAVKYEATLRFLNGSIRSLQDAMRSPSQG